MIIKKETIHTKCTQLVDERIERLKSLIDSAQKASNEDTKSSAGDKYETGRAMMQAEKDKASQQLSEALGLAKTLSQINLSKNYDTVEFGSFIKTTIGDFYISVGLGEIKIDDYKCFAISPISPIGKALKYAKKGEKVSFNNQTIDVIDLA